MRVVVQRALGNSLFALLLTGSAAAGVTLPTEATPRLVLLYAPCTVNREFLSPYDPSIPYTPNLTRLAESSVVFERHQTEAGQSGIAYASILTGAQAEVHGVFRHPRPLPDELTLISEVYADHGYETFFWNDHPMASIDLGYGQGVPSTRARAGMLRGGDGAFLEILNRLASDPDYRAFIFTNFTLTHSPYEAAALTPFRRAHPGLLPEIPIAERQPLLAAYRRNALALSWNFEATLNRLGLKGDATASLIDTIRATYAANIARLDRVFGDVLERIEAHGLVEQSLIAFSADHGEIMQRPGVDFPFTHSMQLTPEVLQIPFILHSGRRDFTAGRYTGVSRSIDVMPTLLGISGLPVPESVSGRDLSTLLVDGKPAPELLANSHTSVLVEDVYRQMNRPETADKWRSLARLFPDESPEWMWVSIREGDLLFELRNIGDGHFGGRVHDLSAPPGAKTRELSSESVADARWLQRLRSYKALLVSAYEASGDTARDDRLPAETERDALRSLGYIE